MGNQTFAIIKPDAVSKGYTGKIYDRIIQAGFNILSAKLIKLDNEQAEGFYMVHKKRPFFNDLINFMTSGPCMVLVLSKPNAVQDWRETIGSTNPDEAEEIQFVKILHLMFRRMRCMVQIAMKMQKKKLPFSLQIVNF